MAIAAPLLPGLEAYRRGDFALARERWEALRTTSTEAAEIDLLLALGGLAAALHAQRQGDGESAARRFAEAEAALGGLPNTLLGIDVLALRADLARGLAGAARHPPRVSPHQRFPLGATLRFFALLALLAGGAALLRFTPLGHLLDRHRLVALFSSLRQSSWAPLALIGLYCVLAPIGLPMTPLIVAGGIVFGRFWGTIYNVVGCVLGGAISYQLGHLLGRDFVRRLGRKRLKRIESLLRRRGFWSLVGVRFMPVPFPVVNYGAAIAGLPFSTFLLTTIIGLTPALAMYTYFASTIVDVAKGGNPWQLVKFAGSFLIVMSMSLIPTIIQQRRRTRRYRRLVIERHARQPGRERVS